MAKKRRVASHRKPGKPARRVAPAQRAVRIPDHVYDPHAFRSLQIGLRSVVRRRGRPVAHADAILKRLSPSLAALERLYLLARRVVADEAGAGADFDTAIRRIGATLPSGAGGVGALMQRTGRSAGAFGSMGGAGSARRMAMRPSPGLTPLPDGTGRRVPCGIVRFEALATLYLVAHSVYADPSAGHPEEARASAFDVIASLSMQQGHMEGLSGTLVDRGIDGLDAALTRGERTGHPDLGTHPEPGPDPSQPPDDVMPDPFGPDTFPEPFIPPDRDDCQWLREACEAVLIESINEGLPPRPLPPRTRAWADTIESIEFPDTPCAGDTMIVHGHGFGAPQPANVQLVMRVGDGCADLRVTPGNWTDTRITVILPDGVRSGTVGFYDPVYHEGERERYNEEARQFNRAAREMVTASKCAGAPLLIDPAPLSGGRAVPCAPDTSVNVVRAGLPIIHSFTISTEFQSGVEIVADPEDILVLRWNVENADTITLQRLPLGSGGPQFDGSNMLADAEGSSYELGPARHTAPTQFAYRLTAQNVCGLASAEVRVFASKRPRLAIQRIEVTQGVQIVDEDNPLGEDPDGDEPLKVPLVEGKPTIVRVHITHGLDGFWEDQVEGVGGWIDVVSSGVSQGVFAPVNGVEADPPDPPMPDPEASIVVVAEPDPTQTDDTLNFLLPASVCDGTLELRASVSVGNFGAPTGGRGFGGEAAATLKNVRFIQRAPVKLRFIPAKIDEDAIHPAHPITSGVSNPPTRNQCRRFLREMLKFLPTTAESIERLEGWSVTFFMNQVQIDTRWGPWIVTFPGGTTSAVYDIGANVFLATLGALRVCELISDYVDVCEEDHDGIWAVMVPADNLWGKANGIPGREFLSGFVSQTASHELAHCLNQPHLTNTNCPDGGNPMASGDPEIIDAANWEDRGEIVPEKAVPFDVIRNQTVTDSDGVWDLMSYCVVRWTTSRRWQMIFDYLGG